MVGHSCCNEPRTLKDSSAAALDGEEGVTSCATIFVSLPPCKSTLNVFLSDLKIPCSQYLGLMTSYQRFKQFLINKTSCIFEI